MKNLDQLSDVQLVALARQQLPHATNAYECLMQRHEPSLFRICQSLCPVTADAEDALQEVFLKVFHNLASFKGDSAFSTWLFRIAHNESLSLLRRRHAVTSENETTEQVATPEPTAVRAGRDCTFNMLLKMLNAEDRSIVCLRLLSELEFNQIADITGLGLSAVKMRYQRALERLKQQIER